MVTVPREAVAVGESSAGLIAGEKLTMYELLEALLVKSGNDAAVDDRDSRRRLARGVRRDDEPEGLRARA